MVFTVERLDLAAGTGPVTVSPPLVWTDQISLAVGEDGRVFVATEAERIVLDVEGRILESTVNASSRPTVAVNADGVAAWSGQAGTPGEREVSIERGSAGARDIIQRHVDCDVDQLMSSRASEWITIYDHDKTVTVPLCAVAGFAWTSSTSLAVSVGTESGAPLITARMPANPDAAGTQPGK